MKRPETNPLPADPAVQLRGFYPIQWGVSSTDLVLAHRARIAGDIGGQYGRKPEMHSQFAHAAPYLGCEKISSLGELPHGLNRDAGLSECG